jgi:hypothetical protein
MPAAIAPTPPEFATLVLSRLGYGPRPGDVETLAKTGLAAFLDEQLAPPKGDDPACGEKLSHATLKIAIPPAMRRRTRAGRPSTGNARWRRSTSDRAPVAADFRARRACRRRPS